jgi:hypothetical protein
MNGLMVLPEGLQLVIKVVDGKVAVAGPVGDKLICYALIEAAKDAIRDFVASQTHRIVPASSMPIQKAA